MSTFLKFGPQMTLFSRGPQLGFDWLIKDANMAKVLDGNYDNKKPINTGVAAGSSQDDLDEFFN